MTNRVVMITGASSGIGAALAEVLATQGDRLVLVARSYDKLAALAKTLATETQVVVADVTVRSQVNQAVSIAIGRFGRVEVVVNNAGRGITCPVSQLTDDDIDEMMAVNVKSVMYATQAILPHYYERKVGHIINISSLLSRVPFAPMRSAYAASKAALASLTTSLRLELAQTYPQIKISCVHPGVVATDFGNNARHGGPDSRTLPNAQTAMEVAHVIADVIHHPQADVYTRPGARELVAHYYAAEDMALTEKRPPFTTIPTAV